MSVHKRKDGQWFVKWREGKKEHRKYFGKNGEVAAKDYESERLKALEDSLYSIPTLVKLTDLYFQAKGDSLHHITRKNIIYYITNACRDFCDKGCDEINRRDLNKMREALGSVKPVTKNRAQAYLNTIFTWGVLHEYIARNPWLGAPRLREEPYEPKGTADDLKAIMAHAAPHLKWAIEVSLNLALRPGYVELLSLKWSAFKWDLGYAEFKQGKNVGLKRVQLTDEFLERAKVRFEEDQKNGIQWVVHFNGRQIRSLKTAWKNAKGRANYEKHPIRLYDIRHIAASAMVAKGADPAAVQHQLGHKRLSTTMDIYVKATPGAQKKAATMLPKLDEE